MNGWIKLHRKCLNNKIVMKSSTHFAIWVWMLCRADVDSGILEFTAKDIIESFPDIDKYKISRVLKLFENEGLIALDTKHKKTRVLICEWNSYQKGRATNLQLSCNYFATKDEPKNAVNMGGYRVINISDAT